MRIGSRDIGPGHPVFVVCDLSANHMGSLDKAHALIDAAHKGGADAIKLQTYRPIELAILRGDGMAPAPWSGRTLRDLYEDAQTPWAWHRELFDHAKSLGMEAFSSTFSKEATQFLVELGVPAIKVSAFEWERRELLGLPHGVPVICSVRSSLGLPVIPEDVALLLCPEGYPAPCRGVAGVVGLGRYARVVGLSDHSVCMLNPVIAVAKGANIIEVHLMLDAESYVTPPLDALHSWTPRGFKAMVNAIRHTEASL